MTKDVGDFKGDRLKKDKAVDARTKGGGLKVDSLDELTQDLGYEILGVLVDCSGSMATEYRADDPKIRTRSDASQLALEKLWEKTDYTICEMKCWSFHSQPTEIQYDLTTPPKVVYPTGGTDFAAPIQAALNENATRIILASDGEAGYPSMQIQECVRRSVPIDTIFIGNPGDHGEAMLQKISDETHGVTATCEDTESLVKQFEQLETHNRLQIEHKPSQIAGPSVIKL